MAEIVNLRIARKAQQRAAKATQAQANRARHGMTKAERRLMSDDAARLAKSLEHSRRED
jgi:hypothetical protein